MLTKPSADVVLVSSQLKSIAIYQADAIFVPEVRSQICHTGSPFQIHSRRVRISIEAERFGEWVGIID